MNWTEKSNMPLYIRLYSLKRKNPALKILLAVGGWSAKSTGFNLATRNAQNRSKFINQTISFLRVWNFDGIDLDWLLFILKDLVSHYFFIMCFIDFN